MYTVYQQVVFPMTAIAFCRAFLGPSSKHPGQRCYRTAKYDSQFCGLHRHYIASNPLRPIWVDSMQPKVSLAEKQQPPSKEETSMGKVKVMITTENDEEDSWYDYHDEIVEYLNTMFGTDEFGENGGSGLYFTEGDTVYDLNDLNRDFLKIYYDFGAGVTIYLVEEENASYFTTKPTPSDGKMTYIKITNV